MPSSIPHKATPKFLWNVWGGLVGTILVLQFTLGGGLLTGVDAGPALRSPIALFAIAQILVASAIRWAFLPKAKDIRQQLNLMIAGIALSGAGEFYGIYLFRRDMPVTKMVLFALSLLSAIQFIPVYAKDNTDTPNG